MRKLKLQMMMSIDGFIAGPEGQLDWFRRADNEDLFQIISGLTNSSDTILMGREMSPGFIGYWESVVDHQPDSPEYSFARIMVDTPKVVFSKSLTSIEGRNVRVENGDVVAAVNELKSQPGKDIIVYGGGGFVSSLIDLDLIDEYNLLVNPVSLGAGLRIFSGRKELNLVSSTHCSNGVIANTLMPQR